MLSLHACIPRVFWSSAISTICLESNWLTREQAGRSIRCRQKKVICCDKCLITLLARSQRSGFIISVRSPDLNGVLAVSFCLFSCLFTVPGFGLAVFVQLVAGPKQAPCH